MIDRRNTLLALAGLTAGCKLKFPPEVASGTTAPAPAPPKTAGELEIAYSIQLNKDGAPQAVPDSHEFQTGDRFRFLFLAGFPAHVYVWNMGPRQTSYRVLFPAARDGWSNPLAAAKQTALPADSNTWFRMDESAGHERFVLVAATHALEEFNTTETAIPRDEGEARIATVERLYRPESYRRFVDRDWTKWFAAARPDGKTAVVIRIPVLHV